MPPSTQDLVRELARKGESFSATVVRLVRLGARQDERNVPLDCFGAGKGPGDFSTDSEKPKPSGPGEGPEVGR